MNKAVLLILISSVIPAMLFGAADPEIQPYGTITYSEVVEAGQDITIDHGLENPVDLDTGAFVVRFYLSTDTVWDGADLLLGESSFAGLQNETITEQVVYTVPSSTEAGSYYLIILIDADGQVTESDETNNENYYDSPVILILEEDNDSNATCVMAVSIGSGGNGPALLLLFLGLIVLLRFARIERKPVPLA